ADGSYSFVWHQGGGAMPAVRVDADPTADAVPAVQLDAGTLSAYAGDYPLMPGFELHVDAADGRLRAQATGQGAFALDAVDTDVFTAPAFGIELRFQRDAGGDVESLELHQGGQVLRGTRR